MPEDAQPCGAHKLGEAIRGTYYDYTCDDCVLPWNHYDPPQINDISEVSMNSEAKTTKQEKLVVIVNESVAASLVKDAGTFLLFGGLMYFNHRALDGHLLIDLVFITIVLLWIMGRNSSKVYSGPISGAIKWLEDKNAPF